MAPPQPVEDGIDDKTDSTECLARSRSKRQKIDKTGRSAAFDKLRKAKEQGGKNKYEIEEEKDVYQVVNEDEYSDIVRQRQEDDWIIDDDGAGYVEDGREIFDEDLDGDEFTKVEAKKKDKKNKNIVRPGSKPKVDIKSMFAAAAVTTKKKVEKNVTLENDELLGDLMEELHRVPNNSSFKPVSVKLTKTKSAKPANPFSVERSSPKVKPVKPPQPRNIKKEFGAEKVAAKKVVKMKEVKIKQEPVDYELAEIEEVNSMDVDNNKNDISQVASQDDSAMDLNDIDFDDEVPDVKPVKQEAPVAVKTEPNPQGVFLSSGWGDVKSEEGEAIKDIQVDSSKLPMTTNESGEQVLRFYWLDAYEDHYRQPGTVYLFGKVWIESANTHVSCCVTVKNIERRVYFLPRQTRAKPKTWEDTGEDVAMNDVYAEFNEKISEKHKIMKFKCMKVTKQYAFEKSDVPVESEYLEVRYGADLPQLPSDLQGETFSHVFGTNTSSLELLLLDRKMKGPAWLDLKSPQLPNPPISWCKVEAVLMRPDFISVSKDSSLSPPPLVVMSLNLRTLPNPKTHQNEIIGASSLLHNNFHMDKPAPAQVFQQHFCAISKPTDCIFPYDFKDKAQKESQNMKIEVLPTERALLGFLLAKIHKVDPDIIVGHDIFGFDIDIFLHRINANKIPHWSKVGRLKRTTMPKLSNGPGGRGFSEKSAACGRMMCDIKISARELIRCRSYDLTELTSQILKQKRVELEYDDLRNMYSSSKQLLQLVELTLVDSTYILKIMYELNVIPLALQITAICGNVMARTLLGGRSERNEFLLLHAFYEKGFIPPDKDYKKKVKATDAAEGDEEVGGSSKSRKGRRKPAYAGGLVLEPKKGFYDKYILLLDFNSLYPSIIQEYNICFTTISRTPPVKQDNAEEEEEEALPDLPDPDLEPGILPTEIRKLVESRRQVKQLMKTPDISQDQYMQYDIRQKALKLTANSMYGCLGFTHSRFYAKPLAALITGKGREILLKTKDLVQTMNLDVIYGDTDSIMINTNSTDMDQVFKLGNKVKSEVNKLYRLLEIDIDGVFKSMLLLKKKKYAALSISRAPDGKITTTQELKGLDIVRRDWCDLSKEAGKFVVSQILSGESREEIVENIHAKLIEVGEKVAKGEVPVELYYITKQLTKNPEEYPDKKSLPHVQVALRLNSKGGKTQRAGDTVSYVICEDGSNLSPSQRAYHPDELAKADNLKIDIRYYLAQQVHPVVSRLCDPIEGTDAAHLAQCLGLDPTGYRQAAQHHDDDDDAMLGGQQMSEEERYKDCERFKVKCQGSDCGREIIMDGVFIGTDSPLECSLSKCSNPQCKMVPNEFVSLIKNQLTLAIRRHINTYYQSWLKCEDTACGARTRKSPLMFQRGHPVCMSCGRGVLHPEYTDSALYTQLCYYQFIFDTEKACALLPDSKPGLKNQRGEAAVSVYKSSYEALKNTVTQWLQTNAYSEVNLTKLFDGLGILK